jgi:hypothetical protein
MADDEEPKLPPHLELQRTRVVCAADAPSYVSPLPLFAILNCGSEYLASSSLLRIVKVLLGFHVDIVKGLLEPLAFFVV